MSAFNRIAVIVMDSVGIGELPDAEHYGDTGSHTLGHIAEHWNGLSVQNLERLGLGRIESLKGVADRTDPIGFYGKMAEVSAGKDTMTGHWELMGLKTEVPFRTFPDGFPKELIDELEQKFGRGILCNQVASGTEVIKEYGEEHMKTGSVIVYTSADSVLQIAAHEEVVPLEELYRLCEIAREVTLRPEYQVGRVIARPFVGPPGNFSRTPNRHDYAVSPPKPTVLNALTDIGVPVLSVGKISDIFNGSGITHSVKTKSNMDGVDQTVALLREAESGFIFTNLVDFDSMYGHRRDPQGYGQAIIDFDKRIPELLEALREDDLLMITADHGNDPTHTGTDHTREYVPILVYSKRMRQTGSLGVRSTYADVGATVADNFGAKMPAIGTSFLKDLESSFK